MQSEVIDKMLAAFKSARGDQPFGDFTEEYRRGVTAAAHVLLDEVLGPVTDEEWRNHANVSRGWKMEMTGRQDLNQILGDRRARIEKPKPVEKRVTVHLVRAHKEEWCVDLDGKSTGPLFSRRELAETFRRGLIAELQQESGK